MLEKVITGGQAGVDRALLDVALDLGINCGGWCPAGRLADDGPIPDRYPLTETADNDHTVRTENNVLNSDATLMINRGELHGGTLYAVELAKHRGKHWLVVDVDAPGAAFEISGWIQSNNIKTLHIGGPREVSCPGIYAAAKDLLAKVLVDVPHSSH